MLTRILLAAPLATFLPFWFAQDSATQEGPPEGPTVELIETTVRKQSKIEGVPFYNNSGLEMRVAVHLDGKPLLSVDPDASRFTKWSDDQGTDLGAGAPTGFFHWVDMDTRFGDDQPDDVAVLTIKTKSLPVAAASRVTFEGVIVMNSASELQTSSADVVLEKGTKFEIAGLEIEVTSVEEEDWGHTQLQLEFTSMSNMDAIQAIRFLGADGKAIEHEDMGSGSMGFGGKVTYTQNYGLKDVVKTVKIEADFFAKIEKVEVPLTIAFGPGL